MKATLPSSLPAIALIPPAVGAFLSFLPALT